MADRGEDVLEGMPFWAVVMNVSRSDDRKSLPVGESGQAPHSGLVPTNLIGLKLHEEVIGTECLNESLGKRFSGRSAVFEGLQKRASAASGEKDEPLGSCEERIEWKGRGAPGASSVRFREEA
jgi:hypothetical protein